jgi:hypothetical protein
MKIAFILLSMVCAVAVSMLVFTLQTGHPPFKPAVVPSPPPTPELSGKGIDLFIDNRSKAVDELINALAAERQLTAKKAAELAAREDELKVQSETVTRLTAELKDAQVRLDQKIVNVEDSERANLRRLADVCSKMDPASASTFLQAMDNERAATILSMVTERPAAAILDAAIAATDKGVDRAADWADIMRRLINNKKATTGP